MKSQSTCKLLKGKIQNMLLHCTDSYWTKLQTCGRTTQASLWRRPRRRARRRRREVARPFRLSISSLWSNWWRKSKYFFHVKIESSFIQHTSLLRAPLCALPGAKHPQKAWRRRASTHHAPADLQWCAGGNQDLHARIPQQVSQLEVITIITYIP